MKERVVIQGVLQLDEVIAKRRLDSKRCRQLVLEILEITDEREMKKKQRQKITMGDRRYSERVRPK